MQEGLPVVTDYFVGRTNELKALENALNNRQSVFIVGEAGIGKTALLASLLTKKWIQNFRNVYYHQGYELNFDKHLLEGYRVPQKLNSRPTNRTLLIIDGFDQIFSDSIKEKISRIIKESRKSGISVIVTSREDIKEFGETLYSIRLRGLNELTTALLITTIGVTRNFEVNPYQLTQLKESALGNPANIIEYLQKISTAKTPIIQVDKQEFDYENQYVNESIRKSNLIIPESPKIIQDIQFVNRRILDKIHRIPEAIYGLSPRDFEILCLELLEERGYDVTLTQATRDGGKDLIIAQSNELGNLLFYAECKRYAPDNPVGVSVISQLAGRILRDRITAGIVITSSYFSPDAKVFTKDIEYQMSLIDYGKLSEMITNAPKAILRY